MSRKEVRSVELEEKIRKAATKLMDYYYMDKWVKKVQEKKNFPSQPKQHMYYHTYLFMLNSMYVCLKKFLESKTNQKNLCTVYILLYYIFMLVHNVYIHFNLKIC